MASASCARIRARRLVSLALAGVSRPSSGVLKMPSNGPLGVIAAKIGGAKMVYGRRSCMSPESDSRRRRSFDATKDALRTLR
jgi:hypothetical protein